MVDPICSYPVSKVNEQPVPRLSVVVPVYNEVIRKFAVFLGEFSGL